MDLQVLLTTIVALAVIELVACVLKKTPLWLSRQCVAAFQRLWKENVLLHGILHDERRFARWRPETAQYVALHAIKAHGMSQQTPQPVLDMLGLFLKRGEPVVLLGEPGAGKTTALEVLTYRLARRAYRYNTVLWFGLLLRRCYWSRRFSLLPGSILAQRWPVGNLSI